MKSNANKGLFERIEQYVLFMYYRLFVFRFIRREKFDKPRVLFGFTPIINNKYWANALKVHGYDAKSISAGIPIINVKNDFDIIIDDIFPIIGKKTNAKVTIQKLKLFAYVLKNYDVVVMSFKYNIFSDTVFWKYEGLLLKKSGVKMIMIPYGSDYYMYSTVIDHSLRHNLMINVPTEMYEEERTKERVIFWKNTADFIIMSQMIDGASRWDCLPVNCLCIDTDSWTRIGTFNRANGKNNIVKIAHTPNHRGFKGTEFIVKAIQELQEEGLKIELILIEKKQNAQVKKILLEEADILIEQIVFTGYALSGIEGMAAGLPVMSNLEREDITQLFRRYSYLNECPIFSTSPENIKDNIRLLVENPELRRELGASSREYAVKYHSFNSFYLLFEKIIEKIWKNETIDLMNFYNPQNPNSYNYKFPTVKHPLVNNKLRN